MSTFCKRIFFQIIIILIFTTNDVFATMSFNAECPDEFEGTATRVFDAETEIPGEGLGHMAKWEIHFDVLSKIRGNVKNLTVIRILKHGPVKFMEGATYTVSLRNGFLCSAKIID
ncbi:MAG: hypothetical protein KAQ98_11805 [Bacteriovoracaceae bacterium]|nr:hypothetical protein [Bacteriovoracaceae bacterium]